MSISTQGDQKQPFSWFSYFRNLKQVYIVYITHSTKVPAWYPPLYISTPLPPKQHDRPHLQVPEQEAPVFSCNQDSHL